MTTISFAWSVTCHFNLQTKSKQNSPLHKKLISFQLILQVSHTLPQPSLKLFFVKYIWPACSYHSQPEFISLSSTLLQLTVGAEKVGDHLASYYHYYCYYYHHHQWHNYLCHLSWKLLWGHVTWLRIPLGWAQYLAYEGGKYKFPDGPRWRSVNKNVSLRYHLLSSLTYYHHHHNQNRKLSKTKTILHHQEHF